MKSIMWNKESMEIDLNQQDIIFIESQLVIREAEKLVADFIAFNETKEIKVKDGLIERVLFTDGSEFKVTKGNTLLFFNNDKKLEEFAQGVTSLGDYNEAEKRYEIA